VIQEKVSATSPETRHTGGAQSWATLGDLTTTLRVIAEKVARRGCEAALEVTRMPVVDPVSRKLLGLISLDDLLKARTRHLEAERHRQQTLRLPFSGAGPDTTSNAATPQQSGKFASVLHKI